MTCKVQVWWSNVFFPFWLPKHGRIDVDATCCTLSSALPDMFQRHCSSTISSGWSHVCRTRPEHHKSANWNHFLHRWNHNFDPDHRRSQVSLWESGETGLAGETGNQVRLKCLFLFVFVCVQTSSVPGQCICLPGSCTSHPQSGPLEVSQWGWDSQPVCQFSVIKRKNIDDIDNKVFFWFVPLQRRFMGTGVFHSTPRTSGSHASERF